MPEACGGFASDFFWRELRGYSGYPVAPSYLKDGNHLAHDANEAERDGVAFTRSDSASMSLRDYLPATDAATSCSAATRSARQSEP